MRGPWSWSVVSLLLASPASLAVAATLRERIIHVEIRPDGTLVERTRLKVRLDSEADREAWSKYAIPLDTNRSLGPVAAAVRSPRGVLRRVAAASFDTVTASEADVLHSSRRFRSITFPVVPIGSELSLDYELSERPYFPVGAIALAGEDAIETLEVEVRGGGAGWRWRLEGSLPGLSLDEQPGGIRLRAVGLGALKPQPAAPRSAASGAVLHYAWSQERDWAEVGAWYSTLLAAVPRQAAAVRARAAAVAGGAGEPRGRLAALLEYVRRHIRYVAVEVGIGGYRPSPPEVVLERAWGDCKDKALLLVDMLEAVGVTAYPALVPAGADQRVDRDFPSPDSFDHLIVAVPAKGLGSSDGALSEGFLFVDPTESRGGMGWLPPALQGQEALVIRGAASRLVHVPERSETEGHRVEVTLELSKEGAAAGEMRVELRGEGGAALCDLAARGGAAEVEASVRQRMARFLPPARLDGVRWSLTDGDPPAAVLTAHVQIADLTAGSRSRSFALPGPPSAPDASVVESRQVPLGLEPRSDRVVWKLALPEGWCAPRPEEQGLENAVGAFRQSLRVAGRSVEVERRAELRHRWLEPASLPALADFARAERQALRRRLRLDCSS